MASELGYVTAAELRNRCADVNATSFTDNELDGYITKAEHYIHVMCGRSTSTPWTNAEDIFEVVQLAVTEDAAQRVYQSIDTDPAAGKLADQAESDRDDYIDAINKAGAGTPGGGYMAKSNGINNQALDAAE